jgi:hypothetical protein
MMSPVLSLFYAPRLHAMIRGQVLVIDGGYTLIVPK